MNLKTTKQPAFKSDQCKGSLKCLQNLPSPLQMPRRANVIFLICSSSWRKRNCGWKTSASVKFTNKCIKSPKTQLSTELCAKQIESANLPDFPAVFVFEICCKKMQIQNHEIDCKVRRTINYYHPYFLFVL